MTTLGTNQDLDPDRLREVFGIFPSGVVAVAALVDGAPVGLAASSFTSVSLDPPLVSFSIANTSKTWPDLRRAAHLGVTILADHHSTVARQLAGAVGQRFDGLSPTATAEGAVTSTTDWPSSTPPFIARCSPATTPSCCCACTPSVALG
jgi:flavin reductase (DIM6/NTAB) family NADH-FMN oxidoreductase RutF